jgi:hypothetical protein
MKDKDEPIEDIDAMLPEAPADPALTKAVESAALVLIARVDDIVTQENEILDETIDILSPPSSEDDEGWTEAYAKAEDLIVRRMAALLIERLDNPRANPDEFTDPREVSDQEIMRRDAEHDRSKDFPDA